MSDFKFRETSLLEQLLGMEGGYVLTFVNRTFKEFFADEDIEIYSDKYKFKGTSKANHMRAFWESEPDHVVGRVLASLIEHHVTEDKRNQELRRNCSEIVARLQASGGPELDHLVDIAPVPDMTQLRAQIERIRQAVSNDPSLAIGSAKELVETVCKTLLNEMSVESPAKPDVPALVRTTARALRLLPEDVPEASRGRDISRRILQNLASIGSGLAELRNLYGTGHGKSGRTRGLSPRHARLAVGAMATLAIFLFETYEARRTETAGPLSLEANE